MHQWHLMDNFIYNWSCTSLYNPLSLESFLTLISQSLSWLPIIPHSPSLTLCLRCPITHPLSSLFHPSLSFSYFPCLAVILHSHISHSLSRKSHISHSLSRKSHISHSLSRKSFISLTLSPLLRSSNRMRNHMISYLIIDLMAGRFLKKIINHVRQSKYYIKEFNIHFSKG